MPAGHNGLSDIALEFSLIKYNLKGEIIPKHLLTECQPGYNVGRDTRCVECGYGFWSDPPPGTEVTQCTECADDRVTSGTTSTSINDCGKSGVTQCSQRSLSAQIVPVVGSSREQPTKLLVF